MTTQTSDIAVLGTGPAGLATALSVAHTGREVSLVGPRPVENPDRPDTRTIALFEGALGLLKNLDVWEALSHVGNPLRAIRIIDDTGHLLRAPEMLFDAHDISRDAFGYNIPNARLIEILFGKILETPNIAFHETPRVTAIKTCVDSVELALGDDGTLETRLLAAADGRNSLARDAAGIDVQRWSYPQMALVCNFAHERPHEDISTEFHRKSGPFTTVPMRDADGKHMSSLVWVETPEEGNRLKALNDDAYIAEMEKHLQGLLGSIASIGPRAAFPLSGMKALRFADSRVALIGEAAHVIPPIGAQGLNLSFRDAAYLADCLTGHEGDPGEQSLLDAYHDTRARDVSSRTFGVDLLNRALISKHYPMQFARGIGLHMLSAIPALKHAAMREGMKAADDLPDLMRVDG